VSLVSIIARLPQEPEFQTGIGVRIAAHSKKAIAPFITTPFKQQSQSLPCRHVVAGGST
jgi:hypothetical protein